MPLLRHRRMRRHLDAYVDDEMNAAGRQLVRRHLRECRSCRYEVELLMRVKRALGHTLARCRR